MSDSVRPHRWQPTRLHHPWDSPGKNAGVGCHFLLQCVKVKSESEVAQSCQTLRVPKDHSLPGSSIHGILQARVLEWVAIALSRPKPAAAAAKLLQSWPTLCDPIDGLLPASSVPGILQARTLEWVAISFSNAWEWRVKVKSLSHVQLLATSWTAAYQAPPSMGFSRQEYWRGCHCLLRDQSLENVKQLHSHSPACLEEAMNCLRRGPGGTKYRQPVGPAVLSHTASRKCILPKPERVS